MYRKDDMNIVYTAFDSWVNYIIIIIMLTNIDAILKYHSKTKSRTSLSVSNSIVDN